MFYTAKLSLAHHMAIPSDGILSFPTHLIEKVARLIDARTLQFPSVGNVLSPWLDMEATISTLK